MKRILLCVVCFLYLMGSVYAVCAEEHSGKYIVRMDTSSLMLLSDDTEDMRYIGNGLYVAESYEDAQMLVESGQGMYMFPDFEMELLDYPETTSDEKLGWHMATMHADLIREKGLNGAGVTVAVVDSGVNAEHPDFVGVRILPGINVMENADDPTDTGDTYGHGTMVSGLIAAATDNGVGTAGLADGVAILPIKVSAGKSLTYSDFYSGMLKAIEADCDVVNISLGGSITNPFAVMEIRNVMKQAETQGKIVVSAVGNSGSSDLLYPAAVSTVIGVGSVNQSGVVSTFSQRNRSVWVTAPGESMYGLTYTGGYSTWQGTSFSAPLVSAIAAIVKQIKPSCTPEEFRTLLKNTATDRGEEGYDTGFGYGIVNVGSILEALSEEIPPFMITYGTDVNRNPRIHFHNNTEQTLPYRGFFAAYNGSRLSGVTSVALNCGVTTVCTAEYNKVFFWNDALSPVRDSLELMQGTE